MRIFSDEFTVDDAINAYVRSALAHDARKGSSLSEEDAHTEAQLAFLTMMHPKILDLIRTGHTEGFTSFEMIFLEQALEELSHECGVSEIPVRREFISESTLDFFHSILIDLTQESIFYHLSSDSGSSVFSQDEFEIATQEFCHEVIESLNLQKEFSSGLPIFNSYVRILLSYRTSDDE